MRGPRRILAIVSIGSPEAIGDPALAAVRARGRIVLFGTYDRGVHTTLDLNIINYKIEGMTGATGSACRPMATADLSVWPSN